MPDHVHPSTFAIILVPLLFAAELFAASGWRPWYFRNGLILFRRQVPTAFPNFPSPDVLEAGTARMGLPPILFRSLAGNELAFRESTVGFGLLHYIPLMHGHIQISASGGGVLVTGRVSWLMVLVVGTLLTVFGVWGEPRWIVLGIVAPVLATYGVQAVRYRRLVRTLIASSAAA